MRIRSEDLPEGFQTRYLRKSSIQTRASDSGELVVAGLSIPFGAESEDLGGFTEIINNDVEINKWRDDVYGLKDHMWNQVLGREGAGTLEVERRDDGLYSVYHLPDSTIGRDLFVSVDREDITGQSFGFIPTRETWTFIELENGEERVIVNVEEMTLFEHTITPIPAYRQSFVGLDERCAQFRSARSRHFGPSSAQKRQRQLDMMRTR